MPDLKPFPKVEILLVTPDNLDCALAQIKACKGAIAIDTETTGLDPLVDKIRLLQIATGRREPVLVFDLFEWETEDLAPLWEFITSSAGLGLVFHNAVFDVSWLWSLGMEPAAHRVRCTMLQERCLVCGRKEPVYGKRVNTEEPIDDEEDRSYRDLPVSLAAVVERRLKFKLAKEEQSSEWDAPELSRSQLVYAAKDPMATLLVHESQQHQLSMTGVTGVAALENKLVSTVVWMQLTGAPVDAEHWRKLLAELEVEQEQLQKAFVSALDEALLATDHPGLPVTLFGEVDVEAVKLRHSPTLLGHLNQLGFGLENLNKQTISLARLDHPVIQAFTRWRSSESLVRYCRAFIKQIRPSGRVHCNFKQFRANSGRFSATNPNLQNIPRDDRFRRGFKALPGWKIIGADYSQIEPRLMAVISEDAALQKIFIDGQDVYKATASLTLGKPIEEITKKERQSGKIAVLALQYGMGAEKFKRYAWTQFGVAMTDQEAVDQRDAFFKAYEGIAFYHRKCGEQLNDAEHEPMIVSKSLMGRRRYLMANDKSYSTLINNQIQSTAADVMKLALAQLPGDLWDAGCHQTEMISVIHDECLLHSPDEEVEKAKQVLEETMSRAAARFLGRIPADVDAVAGDSWAEAKG